MKVLVGGRVTGKTTKMLEWMREHPEAFMVCIDGREVRRLGRENPEMRGRFISWHAAECGELKGRRNVVLAVDNIDIILPYLLGCQVDIVSMTGEGEML